MPYRLIGRKGERRTQKAIDSAAAILSVGEAWQALGFEVFVGRPGEPGEDTLASFKSGLPPSEDG